MLTKSGVRFVRILSGHAALRILRGQYSGTLLKNFVIEAHVEVSDLVLRRHAWPVRFGRMYPGSPFSLKQHKCQSGSAHGRPSTASQPYQCLGVRMIGISGELGAFAGNFLGTTGEIKLHVFRHESCALA